MIRAVFACTDSKSVEPAEGLRLTSWSSTGNADLASSWNNAVRESVPTRSVARLYQGGYWSVARQIVSQSDHAIRGFVVSAGLGFRDFEDRVPSYAATFSPGHDDSVYGAKTREGRRAWWVAIGGAQAFQSRLGDDPSPGPYVVCLPNRYLEVVVPDLVELQSVVGADRLLVFTTRTEGLLDLGDSVVPLDYRMSAVIGGAVGQVTVRAAQWALTHSEHPMELTPKCASTLLEEVRAASPETIYPRRKRQTPAEVATWLRRALRSPDPPGSATAALRRFRGEGLAFEQKRFSELFRTVAVEFQ